MGFAECDENLPALNYFRLRDDGEKRITVFLGEPRSIKDIYNGRTQVRFAFPVLTSNGVSLWFVGTNLYRNIRDNWSEYSKEAVVVTRSGKPNDPRTHYGLRACGRPGPLSEALESVTPEDVEEAFRLHQERVKSGDGRASSSEIDGDESIPF